MFKFLKFWECTYCRGHYFINPKRCRKCYHYTFELVKTHEKDSQGIPRMYGKELIIDLHDCHHYPSNMQLFCEELCELISVGCGTAKGWTDEEADTHVRATSHGYLIYNNPKNGSIYLTVFSRKEFDKDFVLKFAEKTFETDNSRIVQVERR